MSRIFCETWGFRRKLPNKGRHPIQTLLWLRWPFRICHSDTRPKGATRNLLLTSPPHPPQHRDNRGRAALHRRMKQTGKGTTSSRADPREKETGLQPLRLSCMKRTPPSVTVHPCHKSTSLSGFLHPAPPQSPFSFQQLTTAQSP